MSGSFYPRMAWTGIRKNKRLYLPYIITCVGMVMMFYIMMFLSENESIRRMTGGETAQTIVGLGCGVIAVFAALFLFYTNTFLIRRRKKEFGLYNILGMGKRQLARVLLWENLMSAVISLGIGLILGIALSKLAELCVVNILNGEIAFSLTVSWDGVQKTMLLFLVIFGLILLNNLGQIHLTNPIELLRSENVGERPPKGNWFFALVGLAILAGAYYLAVTIEDPFTLLTLFFVAVIMVILATYLLFMTGSVTLCRLLQKMKGYYYKTNHFVSVSSMAYRMKRNGAGLASICILCTMVLVMLSSVTCLYAGMEDSLQGRFSRNMNLTATCYDMEVWESERPEEVKLVAAEAAAKHGLTLENPQEYRMGSFAGYLIDGQFVLNQSGGYLYQMDNYQSIWQLYVISLADYNQLMGQTETLEPGEALLYTTKMEYEGDTIQLGAATPLKVKKHVESFVGSSEEAVQIIPALYLFVPDAAECVGPLVEAAREEGGTAVLDYMYGFDLGCGEDEQIRLHDELEAQMMRWEEDDDMYVLTEGIAKEREGVYGLYGGLFFLGILLGAVFIFAAVLIIYYKQISEGYEDQSRFEIMQKVGMTKREIRRSINSQVLTVFFLPLLLAGVHLCFAFPMIRKMLVLFGLNNTGLLIGITVGCFLLFAVFYMVVYHMTSRAYYHIVSGAKG